MKKFLIFVFVAASIAVTTVFAQGTSTLTGTVIDSDSQTWNFATWNALLVNPYGGTATNNCNNNVVVPVQFRGTLSSAGAFSGTVIQNSCISPAGTSWQFEICALTSAPCSQLTQVAINTSTFDVGSYASALVVAPRFAAKGNAYGYSDVEVPTPIPGNNYLNVNTAVQRCYVASWAACSGGSGGGVASFNTRTGAVTLNSSDVDAIGGISNNTSGTAANLSGTPALPNGTTATTQTTGDNTTAVATDAFVLANGGGGGSAVNINGGPTLSSLQINAFMPGECGDVSGSGTAQSCTSEDLLTPQYGNCIVYQTTTSNSGTALTIDVDGIGARSVEVPGATGWTTTLVPGLSVPANKPIVLCDDGTYWNAAGTGYESAASGTGNWSSIGPETVSLSGDSKFIVSSSCIVGSTENGTITAGSVTSGVLTATAANTQTAGNYLTLSGFGGSYTALNGQNVVVLSSGLSGSQFETDVTGVSNGSTGAGIYACTYSAPQQVERQPGFAGSTINQLATAGNTVANMVATYSTALHPYSPAVTGQPGWLVVQIGDNDFANNGNTTTVQADLQTLWADAHTDGWQIMQETIYPIPSTIFSPATYANILATNQWIYTQGPQATAATNGESWDILADVAAYMPNYADARFYLQSSSPDPYHLTDAGNLLNASVLNDAAVIKTTPPITNQVYAPAGVAVSQGPLLGWGTSLSQFGSGASVLTPQGTPVAGDYPDGTVGAWTPLPFQSLSVVGSSGPATLLGGVLNIPTPSGAATSCTAPCNITTGTPTTVGLNIQGSSGTLTPTFVQSAPGAYSFTTQTITMGSNVTAGDAIFVVTACPCGSAPSPVTDSLGNSYSLLYSIPLQSSTSALYGAISGSSGADIVSLVGQGAAAATEWSGVTLTIDGTPNGASATSVSSLSSGNTTTSTNDLILSALTIASTGGSPGAYPTAAGFTTRISNYSSSAGEVIATQIGAAGSYSANWNTSGFNSNFQVGAGIVAFKAGTSSTQVSNLAQNKSPSGAVISGVSPGGLPFITPANFSTLPACTSSTEGYSAAVNDSASNTFGSVVSGSGPYHVPAYCDGTFWVVM